MKASHLLAGLAAGLSLVGCQSSSEEPTARRTRPEVMDLDDSPPLPIEPAPARTVPAMPPEPVAAPQPAPRKHVVAAKDTLYGLAKTYYGDASKWPRIVEANPGLVPERMPLGKTLIIP